MKIDSKIHYRRSIRLKDFDYSQSGGYFITIVTYQRECLFGEIVDGEMRISPFGKIAHDEWFKTKELRSNVELWEDEFVIMPNHIHGIVWIKSNDNIGAERRSAPTRPRVVSGSLGAIIRAYKSAVTFAINEMRATRGVPVWQRNYYEHIVRNQNELEQIYKYIQFNPIQWAKDEENPEWQSYH